MNEFIQRAPYPVHVLPPMLQDFAQQVVVATESSYEMVVPVMLACMSAAVQGVADVETPYGDVMPVSIFSFVIAKSGDRKSSVLKKVMRGFDDFERGKLSGFSMAALDERKSHQFLIEDATSKGVIDIFKRGAYSLFYALDEAALLFKNFNSPSFCKLFDGSAINEATRTQGVTFLHDRRAALCMLTQDVTFERWMNKKSDSLVESGFMPRVLISQATSGPSPRWVERLSADELENHQFHCRVKELMTEYSIHIGVAEIKRKKIRFTPEAINVWNQYKQQAEAMFASYGDLGRMRAFFRRSGEIICRVAAVLQYFSDLESQVKECNVRAAIDLVAWHLCEADRIFGVAKEEFDFYKEINNLYLYILRRFQRTGNSLITRSEILRCGPILVRKAEILDAAIDNLVIQGRIENYLYQGRRYLKLASVIKPISF